MSVFMPAVALKCPNCSGNLELEDSREFGFCQYCGTKIMIQKVIEQKVNLNVKFDESAKAENLIDLAFQEDRENALAHIIKALEIDPDNSRGWMIRSVLTESFFPRARLDRKDLKYVLSAMTSHGWYGSNLEAMKSLFLTNPELSVFVSLCDDLKLLRENQMEKEFGVVIESFRYRYVATSSISKDLRGFVIYDDELENGFERCCDENISFYNKLLETCNRAKEFDRSVEELFVNISKHIEERLMRFTTMKEKAKNPSPFFITVAASRNGGRFSNFSDLEYYFNDVKQEKVKQGKGERRVYELAVGKHEFTNDGHISTLYIPRLPDGTEIIIPHIRESDDDTSQYYDEHLVKEIAPYVATGTCPFNTFKIKEDCSLYLRYVKVIPRKKDLN